MPTWRSSRNPGRSASVMADKGSLTGCRKWPDRSMTWEAALGQRR